MGREGGRGRGGRKGGREGWGKGEVMCVQARLLSQALDSRHNPRPSQGLARPFTPRDHLPLSSDGEIFLQCCIRFRTGVVTNLVDYSRLTDLVVKPPVADRHQPAPEGSLCFGLV